MKNEPHIDLVTGYLQNTLNSAEEEEFHLLVEKGEIDTAELNEMKNLYENLKSVDVPEPGKQVQERFYTMLEAEKTQQAESFTEKASGWILNFRERFIYRGFAYAAALFLAGLFIGDLFTPFSERDDKIDQLSSEIHQMREMMMINLLENDSPTERLRAVNISNEIPSSADRVAEALLHTLNNDSNVNVRIAAVDALVRHAANPDIRRRMVDSIQKQNSPVVQIALADAMVALQEGNAIEEFRKLLEQNNMDSNVRVKLENTIAALL